MIHDIGMIFAVCLTVVGAFASVIGHGWKLTARLARFFFDKDLDEHKGEKVFKTGLAAFAIGIGLTYLVK